MAKNDLKEYIKQLEKIKAEMEKNLDVEKEVSAEENVVESNVEVSEQEKSAAIKSLLDDSKKIYKKLNSKIKKLKIKSFFTRLLGLPFVVAGGLISLIVLAGMSAFIGGILTLVGSGLVAAGAAMAGNMALLSAAANVLGISALVGAAGGVVSALTMAAAKNDETVDKVLDNTFGIGFNLLDPLPFNAVNADLVDAFDDAKETYNNLKVKYKSEKNKEATV